MSLIKQLWLGIIVLLLLALGGSFFISLVSAKTYLKEQLQLKNMDNATSLALSMSQLDKDPVTLELLISAQFDTGHYRRIALISPHGEVMIEKLTADNKIPHIPASFVRLADLEVSPGIAQVQDGWQQLGTLQVESLADFAVQSLWTNVINLLSWFLIAAVSSGLLGTWVLKAISRPLDIAVQQAEAIGNRRFITSSEPRTYEFRRLVRAMNTLSGSVKVMLEKETRQLEILRRESQQDMVTGLYNREHFFNLLDSQLTRDDTGEGVIAMLRIINLTEINNAMGRDKTDAALKNMAGSLMTWSKKNSHSIIGRLNGSDFAIVATDADTADNFGEALSNHLQIFFHDNQLETIFAPLAWGHYKRGENRRALMHKLDGALAQAEARGNHAVIYFSPSEKATHHRYSANEWRQLLVDAFEQHHLQLARFPVKTMTGATLHFEAPARIFLDQQLQPAGYFVPWASRLGLMPTLDLEVVKEALKMLTKQQLPLAINISIDALKTSSFRETVLQLLQKNSTLCRWLWLEFPESAAIRCPNEFRFFSAALRQAGCHVGLEHAGMEFTHIQELQNIGLNYLKIDGSLIRNIHQNPANQGLVKGMTAIGHSLGMVVIAEGVISGDEIAELSRLGLDGVTGPGV